MQEEDVPWDYAQELQTLASQVSESVSAEDSQEVSYQVSKMSSSLYTVPLCLGWGRGITELG